EGFDPSLRERVVEGTILVVGSNFGIGSSREHVPLAMQASGIRGVVGRSCARIFYRNCVNLGLAIVACPAAADAARDGSRIAIDATGTVEVDGDEFDAPVSPPLVLELGAAGGLGGGTASRLARWRGSLPEPIRRAPRPCVRKLTLHRMSTRTRFWKPIRYQRWTRSPVIPARKPLSLSPWMSATAAARPIVARLPLSR